MVKRTPVVVGGILGPKLNKIFKEVSKDFQASFKGLSKGFNKDSRMFQVCFVEVSRMFLECLKGDSKKFYVAWHSSQLLEQKEGLFFHI